MWNRGKAIEQECEKLEESVYSMLRGIGLNDPPPLDWGACDVRQQNASCEALGFEWLFQQEGHYQGVWFRSSRFPDAIMPLGQFEWIFNPPSSTATESELREQMSRFTTLNAAAPYLRLHLTAIRDVMTDGDLPDLSKEFRRLRMRSFGAEPD